MNSISVSISKAASPESEIFLFFLSIALPFCKWGYSQLFT